MILHLLTDEKFSDYAIEQFSAPEMKSEFVLILSFGNLEMVSLRSKCRIIQQNSEDFNKLLESLPVYDAIILHGMCWSNWETQILQKVPNNVKVCWVLWGGDLYRREDLLDRFLHPFDCMVAKLHYMRCKRSVDTKWEINHALFKRIDYCLADEDEEFEFVKSYTQNDAMKQLWYAYYTIEDTIGELQTKRVHGNGVWLGNSAVVSSNFFSSMLRIAFHGLGQRKLITPISYGEPWVKNRVLWIGKLLFGQKYVPLIDYISRDRYNELMLNCGTMIMPMRLPQAHGNILTGLWLGMRVYMSEKSMAFYFFKRIGAHVYSWESDFKRYGYLPMTDQEVEESREVLMKWYGYKHIEDSVKVIVNELTAKE